MILRPVRLLPSFREKIWGSTELEPWFRNTQEKIGEVWLTAADNLTEDGRTLAALLAEEGAALPILTKFIFTTERLSIQVHPDDETARKWENSAGKTEMWRVLRAGPGASIGLGFVEEITRERLREAAVSGEIERLMRWFPVRAGDVFFTPAGVVHAIGPNVALCEIQQYSDVTYRLYDYGRPRELHLEKGVAVSRLTPHPGASAPQDLGGGRRRLACCERFVVEEIEWRERAEFQSEPGRLEILIFLDGAQPGECWLVPGTAEPFALDAARFLRVWAP